MSEQKLWALPTGLPTVDPASDLQEAEGGEGEPWAGFTPVANVVASLLAKADELRAIPGQQMQADGFAELAQQFEAAQASMDAYNEEQRSAFASVQRAYRCLEAAESAIDDKLGSAAALRSALANLASASPQGDAVLTAVRAVIMHPPAAVAFVLHAALLCPNIAHLSGIDVLLSAVNNPHLFVDTQFFLEEVPKALEGAVRAGTIASRQGTSLSGESVRDDPNVLTSGAILALRSRNIDVSWGGGGGGAGNSSTAVPSAE